MKIELDLPHIKNKEQLKLLRTDLLMAASVYGAATENTDVDIHIINSVKSIAFALSDHLPSSPLSIREAIQSDS